MALKISDLLTWHLGQSEHYENMAYVHGGFASSVEATQYGLKERYSERAKEYRKQAKWYEEAVAVLRGNIACAP